MGRFMNHPVIHLHLVSDRTGGTLSVARRAASSLWPGVPVVEHIHPPAPSRDLLGAILKDIERHPGIVLYNLSDPVMIRNLKETCVAIGCRPLAMPNPSEDAESIAPDATLNSAIRLHLETPPRTWFRAAAGIFAGVLALQAIWMLSIALIRPTIAFPPPDGAAAQAAARQVGVAYASALIGMVRGDLWADYAFALADESLGAFDDVNRAAAPGSVESVRNAATRAARLAPHDSRIWLLLAALDRQTNRDKSIADELKTSYYTGPNERRLRPLRISVALASNAIADLELQSLVTQEIRTIVMHDPALKPSIIDAYRHGSADGRRFLESALAELDQGLLETIRKS
jgi:hypothetical protein